MSYFATITGDGIEIGDVTKAELIEAAKAQAYIARASGRLSALDGPGTVYLIHDRQTGTSDDLVGAAIDAALEGREFNNTDLAKVILSVARKPCTLRIWDAGAVNPVTDSPIECDSLKELLDSLANMAQKGHIKYVRSRLAMN